MTTILRVAALWSASTTRTRTAQAFSTSVSGWVGFTQKSSSRGTLSQPQRSSSSFLSSPTFATTSFPSLSITFMSTSTSEIEEKKKDKIPITLLSGFLGSGKTTALQHLLKNTEGVKIGVVVNDVASVNIDAKLVSGTSASGVVELQNGCACCSLVDELLTSIEQVLKVETKDGAKTSRSLDAVVVELSGVADPKAVQANWMAAQLSGHPVTLEADITQIVTVVDSSTFGTDWMTWDVAGDRKQWVEREQIDDCSAQRKVPELLAEQVEAANFILINKIDLAGPEQVKIASELAKSINDNHAIIEAVEFGRVSPDQILRQQKKMQLTEDCQDPGCTDPTHSHSHSTHDHDHHQHSHNEDSIAAKAECHDPNCNDESHSHSHSHSHEAACNDPDCTDTSHSHSHSHASTATEQLGIVNFVYKANRPFNLRKLMKLLNKWPVPIKDYLDMKIFDEASEEGYEIDGKIEFDSPFLGVLRSKGFCWFAPTKWNGNQADPWRHDTAMYWSHAGKHFGISSAGKWWGTIPKERMKEYFAEGDAEYERILRDDFVSEEFQDRRQEIVFIGIKLDEQRITDALNSCLLSEEKGMERYRQELDNYKSQTVDILSRPSGGLFDVGGGTEFLDPNN